MERITDKDLDRALAQLGDATGFGTGYEPGHLALDSAYGGVKVVRMHEHGGTSDVTIGYMPKRAVYDQIQAMTTIARAVQEAEV